MSKENASSTNMASQYDSCTVENITNYVKQENSRTPNPRLKYLMAKLVEYLHDYVRETRLTNEEWTTTVEFLKQCGFMCSDVRQEFILLSDIFGVSTLVDMINNPTPPNATEATVLGPFYTEDAHDVPNGDSIASPGKGEMCLVLATIKDTKGNPIEGIRIDVWETDGNGLYDNQYENREGPDMRGRLTSNKNGEFYFKCVKPVSYPIPTDGPVGKLVEIFQRHPYRPAHMHFRINDPQGKYVELVTALFLRGDPYEKNDIVFGVKKSLVVDINHVEDSTIAKQYDVDVKDWLIKYDFVMTTKEERQALLAKSTHD